MTITLKALSALLSYPTVDLQAALPEILFIVAEDEVLSRRNRDALVHLIGTLATADLIDAQEAYVELFDRGRKTSLHLFEHVHGDSRDRGPALVDLLGIYRQAGFALAGGELPDYLPALLEYLSTRPEDEAKEMLGDCAHILRAIGEALSDRDSGYGAVFAALLELAGEPGLRASSQPDAADARSADRPMDDEWVEEPVIFGPAAACGAGNVCGTPPPRPASVQFIPRRA